MFGLSASKLVIVLVVVGPRRMPEYARRLRESVTRLKRWASDVRDGMQDGLSDEFAEVDWQSLDPRQYDPRRIVRGALAEDADAPDGDDSPRDTTSTAGLVADSPLARYREQAALRDTSGPAPFDPEAT